jgi:hypothetical protein
MQNKPNKSRASIFFIDLSQRSQQSWSPLLQYMVSLRADKGEIRLSLLDQTNIATKLVLLRQQQW